ncbi:radical SAM protein [bacterium]|nr:radical SAM protein [candidate division CSSED10-310 bacterium]
MSESANNIQAFYAGIHAMPCTNRCQHCWAEGDPCHARMTPERVGFILDKLADLKSLGMDSSFIFYDEPTYHPQFLDFMEKASGLGLIGEQFFLATNGSILAQASDDTWTRLGDTGCACLQLTFYGLEKTHDVFAGRKGAFRDIVRTIHRATEHGLEWYAGVILHPDNVRELPVTLDTVRSYDPEGRARVGWFPFLWQGRGREAKRIRFGQYAALPTGLREKAGMFMQEKDVVERILSSPELADQHPMASGCSAVVFHVDVELNVYWGGSCDSGGIGWAVPEIKREFCLGTLNEAGFQPFLQAYRMKTPRPLKLLSSVTWGELASRYGNRRGDEIYFLRDLPENKWLAAYLIENLMGS